MKKIYNITKIGFLAGVLLLTSACEDFLNRPAEDTYTIDSFYKTDEQCYQAANVLYSAPWFDFQRGFVDIGDVLAGNIYKGSDNMYQSFSLTSSDENLIGASNSLWLVNGHANAVIENIRDKAGSGVSSEVKSTVTGEAMLWKAMAYFYLVRCWGAVPIVHSNSKIIGEGTSLTLKKNKVADVYEYIIRTAARAAELLPVNNLEGRLNKYSAYGLLSKVYLTRSGWGQDGTRSQEDLDMAKEYAYKVISEYPGELEPVYADLFRISTGNFNSENLISWRWVISDQWCSQNAMQSDLALTNFTGIGDTWGSWVGPSIDLQELFGEDAREDRNNYDTRRKATMMMRDDHYDYFWRHVGGFDVTWDSDNNVAGAVFGVGTAANCVKHIVGHYTGDHEAEAGEPSQFMKTDLATHLLRLADVYLIYAEAVLGNNESTSDATAVEMYNRVKRRAIPSWTDATSITFDDIFDERRREFACEGDNWYDYVRLSYYKPDLAMSKLNAQERGYYEGIQSYYNDEITKDQVTIASYHPNITSEDKFRLPFPETDLVMNPNLRDDVEPVDYDFSQIDY